MKITLDSANSIELEKDGLFVSIRFHAGGDGQESFYQIEGSEGTGIEVEDFETLAEALENAYDALKKLE